MSAALAPESKELGRVEKFLYPGSTIKNVPSGALLFS